MKYWHLHEICLSLFPEMRHILKYLIPVIAAIIFLSGADKPSSHSAEQDNAVSHESLSCQSSISATDSEICLPRQEASANVRLTRTSAGNSNALQRNNPAFAKSGRMVSAALVCFIQTRSIIFHSSHIEPAHRLLALGKLII